MKTGRICGYFSAVALVGSSLVAFADVQENPYQVIIDRNPFGLKPIPVVVNTVADTNPPPPAVEIKLTGISNLGGDPKAFLEIVNTQTKKTERPRPLGIDDSDMNIKILSIDAEKGLVRVRNGDAESTLDFEKNGIKPTATASAAPVPPSGLVPLHPVPTPGHPMPVAVPGARGAIVAGNNGFTQHGTANTAVPNTMFSSGAGAVPSRQLRVGDAGNVIVAGGGQPMQQKTYAQPAPPLSAVDAAARIEAQRQMLLDRERSGKVAPGTSAIMPPTEFSPPGAPGLPGQ